jgi:hypothetical protein
MKEELRFVEEGRRRRLRSRTKRCCGSVVGGCREKKIRLRLGAPVDASAVASDTKCVDRYVL